MATSKKNILADTYFDRLTFDPKLATSWIAKYLGSIRLVVLLILTISLGGIISYFNLPKRLNPEIEIPFISVVTVLPGASPEDLESLITVPLENELKGATGLDTITSVSQNNVSVISLQFVSTVSPADAKDEVQSIVDSVTDLPDDANTTQVTALDFEDQPIWVFSLTGQDERSLMNMSETLKIALDDLAKVDRVTTSGFDEQEYRITIEPEKVSSLELNPLQLSWEIQKNVAAYPAGEVVTTANSFPLSINPTITSLADLRLLPIQLQRQSITLGEIARVEEVSKPNQAPAYLASPDLPRQRAVTFYVYKASNSDITEANDQVQAKVSEIMSKYPDQFLVTTIINTSDEITDQFSELLAEFRTTIILVFLCLLIFLGLRQAVIASFTVPLTFLSAFMLMNMIGMSINFLSLFAFLLALGLLVDDTIVVVSAMTSYYKVGRFTPLQTGLLVWRDTIVPIWSTTLTTIWSFVPLLLSTGIIGEFIKPIPVVVTVTMLSSTGIAVLITLPIMMVLLQPHIPNRVILLTKLISAAVVFGAVWFFLKDNPLIPLILILTFATLAFIWQFGEQVWQQLTTWVTQKPVTKKYAEIIQKYSSHGLINLDELGKGYAKLIESVITSTKNRRLVILAIVIYALFGFGLVLTGQVKSEFFPKSNENTVSVVLELPAGTKTELVDQETQLLLEKLRSTAASNYTIAEVSTNISNDGNRAKETSSSLFTIHLLDSIDRKVSSAEVAESIRSEFATYSAGELSVIEVSGGPPAGADLQIQFLGNDLELLEKYTDEMVSFLTQEPGVTNVGKSVSPSTSQVVFVPNKALLAEHGIGVDQLGFWLRLTASGFTLDSVNFDKSKSVKQDISFRFEDDTVALETVSRVHIPTAQGPSLPLLTLGHFETQANPTLIARDGGKRSISVTAGVKTGYNVADVNKKLEAFAGRMDLAAGYSWKTGGVNEENQKSVTSILQAMVVSVILILVTMVLQFGSFRQAFIVLIVIPLAVSSVFVVFALTGTPLSFPALIGVLSLFGIVVTNSMFIVDKINRNQTEGMKFIASISDAGASRLEPIILTKLCTVLGLLPITIADPLWRGLGGAIISGLLISSTIMLLFIPALYYEFYKQD